MPTCDRLLTGRRPRPPTARERVGAGENARVLSGYLERGDAALITHDDQSKPVKQADEWRGIIRNSRILNVYAPPLTLSH